MKELWDNENDEDWGKMSEKEKLLKPKKVRKRKRLFQNLLRSLRFKGKLPEM